MASPLPKLIALLEGAIADATARYQAGGSAAQWQKAMQAVITRGTTATYMVATAERLGVSVETLKGFSRTERAEIRVMVQQQLSYLPGFVQALPTLSAAQIGARALQYATGIKTPYYQARWGGWDIPDELLPGNQKCQGNCNCSISISDNGDGTGVLTRKLNATAHNCDECPPLEGEYAVNRMAA
jgi:hypothetical protein